MPICDYNLHWDEKTGYILRFLGSSFFLKSEIFTFAQDDYVKSWTVPGSRKMSSAAGAPLSVWVWLQWGGGSVWRDRVAQGALGRSERARDHRGGVQESFWDFFWEYKKKHFENFGEFFLRL